MDSNIVQSISMINIPKLITKWKNWKQSSNMLLFLGNAFMPSFKEIVSDKVTSFISPLVAWVHLV